MLKRVAIIVLVSWGGFHWWTHRPVSYGAGVAAAQLPVQQAASEMRPFDYKGYRITPLARFSLEARVLGREDYRFGREADLSPTDLTFGWGRMSDAAVLQHVEIRQSNRFYYWSVKQFPIPQREIETSSANMHLIPADGAVQRMLDKVRQGQVVRLRGYLVRADAADGWHWVSSLTRDDVGAGACELIWVEDITNL
jgi:hypothetical protein